MLASQRNLYSTSTTRLTCPLFYATQAKETTMHSIFNTFVCASLADSWSCQLSYASKPKKPLFNINNKTNMPAILCNASQRSHPVISDLALLTGGDSTCQVEDLCWYMNNGFLSACEIHQPSRRPFSASTGPTFSDEFDDVSQLTCCIDMDYSRTSAPLFPFASSGWATLAETLWMVW